MLWTNSPVAASTIGALYLTARDYDRLNSFTTRVGAMAYYGLNLDHIPDFTIHWGWKQDINAANPDTRTWLTHGRDKPALTSGAD